jgi:pimeloyl-ACP methyl ester carboxylesterase
VIAAEYHDVQGNVGFAEVAGDGVPLLCVHSAGQSGAQWRTVLRDLPGHGYRVIVPDLPGHGRSAGAPEGPVTDLRVYARWLAELLDRLGARRPAVVGCSIGGKIALELATDPAVAPRCVVAMAADAHNTRLSIAGLERELEDTASPSRGDRTYHGTLACVGSAVDATRAHAIASAHRREDPLVTTSDLIGWARHDLRDRLGDIRCPVRLVVGEDDFWIDPGDVARAAELIPGCVVEVLPGIGHYPMEELADFPRLLLRWLEDLK